MRLPAALVVAGVVAVLGAAPCAACSCAPRDPREMLTSADAAFVGVLVKKEIKNPPLRSSAEPAIYTFRVEEEVKGRLGDTIDVESAVHGASCGLEVEVGQRTGVIVARRRGVWTSNMCSQLSPAELRAAARPLPRPNGRGAAAVVVAGGFGEARVVSLDVRGRTLGYGRGHGETAQLAGCPGGRRVVELVVGEIWSSSGRANVRLAVRKLPKLELVRELRLPQRLLNLQKQEVRALSCRDERGEDVLVFARRVVEGVPNASTAFRVRGRSIRVVYKGFATQATFGRGHAYLADGPRAAHLLALNLATHARRRAGTLPPDVGPLSLSHDGRRVAGYAPRTGLLAVVRLRDGRVRRTSLPHRETGGAVTWTRNGSLLFLPSPIGDGHVFDASLRRIARLRGWSGSYAAARGGRVFGVSFNGAVAGGSLPRGPVRFLRHLPGRAVYAVTAVE